jgi:ATP phosphoribosyltransferase regulatory subunit
VRSLIERFLAISGDPDSAAAELRALADQAKLDLGATLDAMESRTGFFAARGLDVGAFKFATAFGRGFDYYTGFVFEVTDGTPESLVAGGRYDGLLTRLGSASQIPAVGFAASPERLAAAGGTR